MSSQVLVVSSFSKAFYHFTALLRARGVEAKGASTVSDARPMLVQGGPALIICAAELLDGTYRDILSITAHTANPIPVVVFASMADGRERQEAIALGATDCVRRPLSVDETEAIVQKALDMLAKKPTKSHGAHA